MGTNETTTRERNYGEKKMEAVQSCFVLSCRNRLKKGLCGHSQQGEGDGKTYDSILTRLGLTWEWFIFRICLLYC